MTWSLRAGLTIACTVIGGCSFFGKELSAEYCAAHPDDSDCRAKFPDAAPDGPQTCTSTPECTSPLVCDVTGSMTCVECTTAEHAACTGSTPACIDNTCKPCTAHTQCTSSSVCLPDGTCADAGQVAYVDPSGTDNTSCTFAMPCTEVAKALATGRMHVKFKGTNNEQVTLNSRNVTFHADPGAKLTDTSNGILLRIDGTSQVTIYDLEISGASGVTNPGISMQPGNTATLTVVRAKLVGNQGGGISASGGSLIASQSTFSGNTGGGISMTNGTFVIVGNVFFNNGNDTTLVGGVAVGTAQSATNRLEFNSFTRNKTQNGLGTAIQCVAGTFTARNNIMSENGTLTNLEQIGGTCSHTYSIARPGTLPTGTGNKNMDPLFANTTTGDLHLMAGSPALGAADPTSSLTGPAELDIDKQRRTSPADMGADEVP